MKENELAIERGIRSELVEDFMSGLKTLFTEHYIDLPEEKVDMVDDLFTKVEELEGSLDEEINREEVSAEHQKKCEETLSILKDQRYDLEKCLMKLIIDLSSGKKILKVYQQMKMYNDESLNPVLYKKFKSK